MKREIRSREEWLEARKALLAKEKEFTRLRDQLSQQRRELPWVKVEPSYEFEGPDGDVSLADLFDGKSQLLVYHFMLGPDWEKPCKSCSFWADNFNGIEAHLAQRDVSMVTISRAPFAQIQGWKERMGWAFPWYSSHGSSFNYDYHVSFTDEERKKGECYYNYTTSSLSTPEAPGVSVFYKDDGGEIFHTYSCYSRGLDMLNGAYHYLDLVPKGRDEGELSYPMAWLRLRHEYE